MSDLADRVLAAIEETEAEARRLNNGWPTEGNLTINYTDEGGTHEYGVYSPAAVLRRCAADREIVELHRPTEFGMCECCIDTEICAAGDSGNAEAPCVTLLGLARGYGITEEES